MPRVVVAEDDTSIRALIVELLRLEGFDVEEFGDGARALHAIRGDKPPAAVVLDIMMPQLDGLALLNEIRANGDTQNLPVVLLTAKTDDATTWAGWSSGCDYYMTKPFEPDELIATVNRLTKVSR